MDQSKRNPEDFGLWFTRSKFENQAMIWDSPWGRGYPGWHIECSAMAMRYLQEQFDIHCGGIDLIPVHHTNEIAQAEAALGIEPQSAERWVNYWCHGEFLMVNGAKMSKSKGNWVTIGQLQEQGYDALDFRFFVLGAHYRAHQNFTMRALAAARTARLGLIARVAELGRRAGCDLGALEPAATCHPAVRAALDHAANDLAMPRVVASLWQLVKDDEGDPEQSLRAVAAIDGFWACSWCRRRRPPRVPISPIPQSTPWFGSGRRHAGVGTTTVPTRSAPSWRSGESSCGTPRTARCGSIPPAPTEPGAVEIV